MSGAVERLSAWLAKRSAFSPSINWSGLTIGDLREVAAQAKAGNPASDSPSAESAANRDRTTEHLNRIEEYIRGPGLAFPEKALESLTALRSTIAEMGEQLASLREREFAKQEACVDLSREVNALTAELSETKSAMEEYAAESDAFCGRSKLLTAERDKAIRDLGESEQKIAAAQAEREEVLRVLEPLFDMALCFCDKTQDTPAIEGKDRIEVKYPWAEFRASLRVRDLRALAALHARLSAPQARRGASESGPERSPASSSAG